MNLVIGKCVTAVKVSNFTGDYLPNRSTLDIGVLGFFGIVSHKEHPTEVWSLPPVTHCVCVCVCVYIYIYYLSTYVVPHLRHLPSDPRQARKSVLMMLKMSSSRWTPMTRAHGRPHCENSEAKRPSRSWVAWTDWTGIRVSEDNEWNGQRAAPAGQGVVRMLAVCEEILMVKKRSVSPGLSDWFLQVIFSDTFIPTCIAKYWKWSRSKAPLQKLRNLRLSLRREPWRFESWLSGLNWLKLASGCLRMLAGCKELLKEKRSDSQGLSDWVLQVIFSDTCIATCIAKYWKWWIACSSTGSTSSSSSNYHLFHHFTYSVNF